MAIKLKIIMLIIGAGILNLGIVGFVSAVSSSPRIDISPLRFEITANPGDIVTNKLRVYNSTDSTISIKMEAEDFRAVGETGQVIVAPEEEITYSLKRWVTAEPAEFTLEPKEQKFVDFTISIPENAEPGGKYGSILATITGVISGDITGTAIAQKVGSLVLLTLSGEVKEDLLVKEFSAPNFPEYGPIKFIIRFENKGSVHVKPIGSIVITNQQGKKVASLDFSGKIIFPNAIRKFEIPLEKEELPGGKYIATFVGHYGEKEISLNSAAIDFSIPAEKGPEIISFTHPNQNEWYRDNNPTFFWSKKTGITNFSYSFNQDPAGISDDESEGDQTSVSYKDVESGIWYFHIKAKKKEVWGEESHYSVRIDTIPPDIFTPEIKFFSRATEKGLTVSFTAIDVHSGIDHYQIGYTDIANKGKEKVSNFIEAASPYQLSSLENGEYLVAVRAHDKAGNYREETAKVRIFPGGILITKKGIHYKEIVIGWWLLILVLVVILCPVGFYFRRKYRASIGRNIESF